jgi:phosphoadenosine phosphosulfate reductase
MTDKINVAIERIRTASELSLSYYGKPLIVLYSGGKDSDTVLKLTQMSGVPFEALHNHTTVDAPPTVYHIRKRFRELELDGVKAVIEKPRMSMWQLIIHKKMPPTRVFRYCCHELKERGGANRHLLTGVRRAESTARAKRGIYESINKNPDKRIILHNDNDDRRMLTEQCFKQRKTITNPIIDWSNKEVRDFCKEARIALNPLYECEFQRVGCIGCPMANKARTREFEMFPKYKNAYLSAFAKMIAARTLAGKSNANLYDWSTPEAVMHRWLQDNYDPNQISIFTEDEHNEPEQDRVD